MAVTRNLCGEFVEEATALIGKARRLKTDGTADYCPDLQRVGSGIYYETKSIGCNGSAIIYETRLEKDRWFNAMNGGNLVYWFWRHRVKIKDIPDDRSLWKQMSAGIDCVILLPFAEVYEIAQRFPLRTLNRHYSGGGTELGYGNRSRGYGDGRSIRLSALRGICDSVVYAAGGEVMGIALPEIPVFTTDRLAYLVEA